MRDRFGKRNDAALKMGSLTIQIFLIFIKRVIDAIEESFNKWTKLRWIYF